MRRAVDAREGASVALQFLAMSLEEGAAGKEREVHRRPVVAEAGQRVFAGLHRPARHGGLLEHAHAPVMRGKMQRRSQRIVAGPDDDRVELGRHPLPLLSKGYLQTHPKLSSILARR